MSDMLKTPNALQSPSHRYHQDGKAGGSSTLNGLTTPFTSQAFFGDNEPFYSGNIEIQSISRTPQASLPKNEVVKEEIEEEPPVVTEAQTTTIHFRGSITTTLPLPPVSANPSSPGLSASVFQFSPLVEHFFQSLAGSKKPNNQLPELVVGDSSGEFFVAKR